jgi:hypothetical protein
LKTTGKNLHHSDWKKILHFAIVFYNTVLRNHIVLTTGEEECVGLNFLSGIKSFLIKNDLVFWMREVLK